LGEWFNVRSAWHGPGDVSPVGHAANAHLDLAIWNFGIQEAVHFSDETRERAGSPPRPILKHIFRPRTILYTALWAAVGLGLLVALFMRSEIDLTVSPVRNPMFVTMSDGSIRNTYDVRLRNKLGEERTFVLSVSADQPYDVEVEGSKDASVAVPADSSQLQRVYVTAPADTPAAEAARSEIRIWVEDPEAQTRAYTDTVFNGREEQ